MVSKFIMTSRVQALVSFTALATLLCPFNVYAMDPTDRDERSNHSSTSSARPSEKDNEKCIAHEAFEKTMEYLQLAADQGHAMSQYQIGALYETGCGVEKDLKTAFTYYNLAADQGNSYIQYEVCLRYIDHHQFEKGLEYMHLAADHGHAKAQFETGTFYECEKDLYMAFKYYNLAAAQGYADALDALGRIYEQKKIHEVYDGYIIRQQDLGGMGM